MLGNIYPTNVSLVTLRKDEIKKVTSLRELCFTDVSRFTIDYKLNTLFELFFSKKNSLVGVRNRALIMTQSVSQSVS